MNDVAELFQEDITRKLTGYVWMFLIILHAVIDISIHNNNAMDGIIHDIAIF